ncbi:hypothetical protein DH2020_043478 [Rehmannia glutinosa]|uniref:Pseudouridine-5'-phosphate glycosidase n=1 Tax=Rehmannia glutinosa TaxID=99300 RepID=A0ABR0UJK9_REHGL
MASWALSRITNLQKHFNPTNPTSKGERMVKISPEVSEALSLGKAVVALESTIISHGKVRNAISSEFGNSKEVEAIVRQNGAIPATIAILDGIPCVGLSAEELERLAILGRKARKTARRDIAHVVATGGNGATTVSTTMFFASMVGIPIFVTGGIGGVHRHGESSAYTMDISSDLIELGRTPVAVVSAGVKSILDISRTLEYLETQGVCVAAYQTSEFPAFFTQKSGCQCKLGDEMFPTITDTNINLQLKTGILIAVPIPSEHSSSGNIIESAIQRALKEAREQNISGSAETPFLLARVNELTGGTSFLDFLNEGLDIALVKNNARIGAQIAVSLSRLQEQSVPNGADGSATPMIGEANNYKNKCKSCKRMHLKLSRFFTLFLGFVSTALSEGFVGVGVGLTKTVMYTLIFCKQ